MKKSTWKKLFTRRRSKSGTRAGKKGKLTVPTCSVCAGISVINAETLCNAHRDAMTVASATPQIVEQAPAGSGAEVTDNAAEKAESSSQGAERIVLKNTLGNIYRDEKEKPLPLVRTSTNEEFMSEEVDSHNLSDNSRTEENVEQPNENSVEQNKEEVETLPSQPVNIPSAFQESSSLKSQGEELSSLEPHALELIHPSGTTDTYVIPHFPDVPSGTLETQDLNARGSTEIIQHSSDPENLVDASVIGSPQTETSEEQAAGRVESKNRKNIISSGEINPSDNDLVVEDAGENQSVQEKAENTTNNEEFMSDEVQNSESNASGEGVSYPKFSPQVSSAITIPRIENSSSGHNGPDVSQLLSNQDLDIVEVEIPMEASHKEFEDLSSGNLQAQRSSRLDIHYPTSVEFSSEERSSGANKAAENAESATESEVEQLPPPPGDYPAVDVDSGLESGSSSTSESKDGDENAKETESRQSPTIIFGTIASPEQESAAWSTPMFFGSNAIAQGLNMSFAGADRENPSGQETGPFQGFGIIGIMRDLYSNESSDGQMAVGPRVTEITDESKASESENAEGQAPPSLDEEESEDPLKEVMGKKP